MPNSQKLNTMVKRTIDQKTLVTKLRRQKREIEADVTSRRRKCSIERGKEFAMSEKQKVSVREETNAVSDTRVMNVKNRNRKPLHPLSHQHQEVEVRRENRGRSQSGKSNRAKT